MDKIEATMAAYSQSITAPALAGLVVILGIIGGDSFPLPVTLLIALCYLLYFLFSRRLVLSVAAGAHTIGIGLKRGVLGSMQVDFALVESAVAIIDAHVSGRPATAQCAFDSRDHFTYAMDTKGDEREEETPR